jgi:hypothetical protein
MSSVLILSDWEHGDDGFLELHHTDEGKTNVLETPNFPKFKIDISRVEHEHKTVFRITMTSKGATP